MKNTPKSKKRTIRRNTPNAATGAAALAESKTRPAAKLEAKTTRRGNTAWIFDSMTQAASVTGTPLAVLKAAKAAGCPAFELGSRVDFLEFNRWHYEHGIEGEVLNPAQEKAKLNAAQRAKIEREERVARGELVHFDEVEKKLWDELLLPLRQAVEVMPESIAPLANPERPEVARKVLGEWWEKVKGNFRAKEQAETKI